MSSQDENFELMTNFLKQRTLLKDSAHTIKDYKIAIRDFLLWYGDRSFYDIEYSDAEDYFTELAMSGRAPKTLRLKRSALSTFSKWLRKRSYKNHPTFSNVFIDVELPSGKPIRERTIWTEEEALLGIEAMRQENRPMFVALLALALYSGRRAIELTRFKVSDFDESRTACDGLFYISNRIQTKGRNGGKFIECYTSTKFRPFLEEWLKIRPQGTEWLFPDETNTTHINYAVLLSFGRRLDYKINNKHFHWHAFRHCFTTTMLKAGVPAEIVKEIVGWESADMVSMYNDQSRQQTIENFYASKGESL